MNDLIYSRSGDYLLPNLALTPQPGAENATLGKYGRLRRSFLKQHRAISYNSLLLSEKLYPHLWETEETANRRMEQLMAGLTQKNPPPDKKADQMAWTAHMNSLRQQAEEVILHELIYI
ncbi:TnpV protein [Oscillibacter sp. GMB15532]|uniref:TnpV protein n=1 Tax=Oscillibacter sp. GMB15532 TaxID=3230022 RepID=UPI0034DFA38E